MGGIGEINFGKQYRQGNRVYDSNAIAMCLTAQPLGNAGGYSYLYAVGAAMRGRYNSDGKIEQQIEVRDDELSNAITTVQKDSLVVENKSWLEKKYAEFYEKYGYIPEYFEPYNCREIKDYSPTLTAHSNAGTTFAGTVLITEIDKEKKQ